MPKIITIDSAVVSQVRLTTDATGAIRVHCDYTLNSGKTPIQALSDDVTALLSPSDQSAALAVVGAILKALGSSQGVQATGPTFASMTQPTVPLANPRPQAR